MSMFQYLGLTLKVVRELREISQSELARAAGVGKSQLSKYERGMELPKLTSLERLLKELDVPALAFFETLALLDRTAAECTSSPGLTQATSLLRNGISLLSQDTEAAFEETVSSIMKLHRVVMKEALRSGAARERPGRHGATTARQNLPLEQE